MIAPHRQLHQNNPLTKQIGKISLRITSVSEKKNSSLKSAKSGSAVAEAQALFLLLFLFLLFLLTSGPTKVA